MSRALLSRLGKVEASRRGQGVKGRDKATTDGRVSEALASLDLGQALKAVKASSVSSIEQQEAAIRAAYQADH